MSPVSNYGQGPTSLQAMNMHENCKVDSWNLIELIVINRGHGLCSQILMRMSRHGSPYYRCDIQRLGGHN